MSNPKVILTTSASGNIGRNLVPLLQNRYPPPKVVLPTSNATKLQAAIPSLRTLDSQSNVHIAEGSVKDPVWFQALLTTHKVDTVFLCLTDTDELFTALNCLDALSRVTSVRRVVYLSIIGDFTSQSGFEQTVRDRGYAHIFPEVVLEQRLKYGNLPFQWTVLGPTVFFDNDKMQKSNLIDKSFLGTPLSTFGANRVSLQDIALAVRNAMYDNRGVWAGRKVQLGSKRTYTGNEMLEIWSRALDNPIDGLFSSADVLERFELQTRQFMISNDGKAFARSLRGLLEFLMTNNMAMSEEEYKEQVTLLGKESDDYETWVRMIAKEWLQD